MPLSDGVKGNKQGNNMSKPAATRPLFVAVDGIDGVGKTTIAFHVAELLQAKYIKTNSEGPIAKAARARFVDHNKPQNDTHNIFFMVSSIAETFSDYIEPQLNAGKSVVVDRWTASTYAYQLHGKPESPFRSALMESLFFSDDLIKRQPDLYLYCNADLDAVEKRIADRGEGDRLDALSRSERQKLHEGFNYHYSIAHNAYVIDCNGPLTKVFSNVTDAVNEYLEHAARS